MPRKRSSKAAEMRSATTHADSHDFETTQADDLARVRAEADAAIAQAEQAHARLRDAIEILPHGLVFLDADGRYILWNKQYSDIY